MFGAKKEKKGRLGGSGTTLLARSVEVLGDVRFAGHLEVEGKVAGNIYAEDGSDARVRVLDQGVVEGEIHAPNVVINGHVTGDVRATGHLELAAHAVVNGNVYYQIIEMVKGAQVNGSLVHVREDTAKAKGKPEKAAKPEVAAKPGEPVPASGSGSASASGRPNNNS